MTFRTEFDEVLLKAVENGDKKRSGLKRFFIAAAVETASPEEFSV